MVERRWHLRLVPPAAGLLVAGLLATSTIGATSAAWDPPPCGVGSDGLRRAAATEPSADVRGAAWFTLNPVLDASGALSGQRLRVRGSDGRERALDLPAESWAAGPSGSVVLVAADDERRSTLTALDVEAGCAWAIGATPAVVRRAVLDPDGSAVYEFRVDRRTRADLGVWRRPLDGTAASRLLAPAATDDGIGRVFTTTLAWSAGGDRLAVQSCGAIRCRTRLVDPASGDAVAVGGAAQGELVGVAGRLVIHYAPCLGLPCSLLATDSADGSVHVLVEAAGLARLVATPDGPRVAAERPGGGPLQIIGLDGALERAVGLPDSSLRLMPSLDRAAAGARVPPGWLVLAPDGRSPDGAVLARLGDGSTVEIVEVTR
jgi:hypothetical protein